jgi:hypothetical protein
MDEDCMVYEDPGNTPPVRRLRGKIEDDGKSEFVTVRRQDGIIQVARRFIIKMEKSQRLHGRL